MPKILKVVSVKKDIHQETNSPFLDVTVELSDIGESGEVITSEVKKFGYPFGTSAEVIKQDLTKVLSTTIADEQLKVLNAETEELNKQADEVINEVSGFELGSDF